MSEEDEDQITKVSVVYSSPDGKKKSSNLQSDKESLKTLTLGSRPSRKPNIRFEPEIDLTQMSAEALRIEIVENEVCISDRSNKGSQKIKYGFRLNYKDRETDITLDNVCRISGDTASIVFEDDSNNRHKIVITFLSIADALSPDNTGFTDTSLEHDLRIRVWGQLGPDDKKAAAALIHHRTTADHPWKHKEVLSHDERGEIMTVATKVAENLTRNLRQNIVAAYGLLAWEEGTDAARRVYEDIRKKLDPKYGAQRMDIAPSVTTWVYETFEVDIFRRDDECFKKLMLPRVEE